MFKIEQSTEIAFRADFSLLCNARGLRQAIEVGTDRAVFVANFMSRWNGSELYCVDPYEPYDEMLHDRMMDMFTAALAMMPWHGRVKFLRARSPGAVKLIPHWVKAEFIYIDGDHRYENVKMDVDAWWRVLQPSGILAGHDFDDEHPGVMKAVNEFAQANDLVVRITQEPNPSWYIYRNEPRFMIERFFKESHNSIPNPYYESI